MSAQLFVYPQNYNGQFNTISSSATEVLVNGISFSGLNNTSTYTSSAAQPYNDTITNAPASIINTWYRFRVGAVDFPVVASGGLVLKSLGSGSSEPTGIYQQICHLTPGQQYMITINVGVTVADGYIVNRLFNGSTQYGSTPLFSTSSSVIQKIFTAAHTELTYMLVYYANSATNLTIDDISIQPIIGALPSNAADTLSSGVAILDLYENEDLPLTLSVDNFKNAAEQVQSYSKAFNLPGTKRNNQIFDEMYEITRSDNGLNFNPYKKTKAVLKENGFLIFEGYLRMLDITNKEGEISYNVNLYSEVTALADILGERTFSQLDFSELEHDYNISNITDSWDDILPVAALPVGSFAGAAGATTTDVLKYPNVDWNHQVSADASGNPVLSNLECAFRPFIKLKYCIDMIFGAPNTPFSYTSAFFDSAEFGRLYMDFNWGADNAPVVFNSSAIVYRNFSFSLGTSFTTIDFDYSTPATLGSEFGYSSGVFTAQTDNQFYNISFDMEFILPGLTTPPEQMTIQWLVNGVATDLQVSPFMTTTSGGWHYQGVFSTTLSAGDTILCQAKSTGTDMKMVGGQNLISVITSSVQTANATLLQTLRGELGQWDFLKGIMTMFNLITMPDPDNLTNLLIEPYSNVFITNTTGESLANRSIQHDWTEKIDISEMNLKPLTDLNLRTIFKFVEDDDDFCFSEYKRQVGGHLYGSLVYSADEFNILTGEKEIVAEPFAATVIKPLEPQYSDFIIPAIYAKGEDGECSGFDNAPRIMYNNGKKTLTSCTYKVPEQNGSLPLNAASNILQFSHLSSIPTVGGSTVDYLFGIQQLVGNIVPVSANLFTRFWLPYYSQLYNPNTRTMTIKVNLNAGDINLFKFNDKVFIKNRIFRVNKIDYKPNDLAKVEFILIG